MSPAEFIDALTAVYRLNSETSESEIGKRQWVQAMLRLLRPYEAQPKVLERAYENIIAKHKDKYRWVPLPAVCLEACHEAKDWLDAAAAIKKAEETGQPAQTQAIDTYTAAKLRADKLLEDNRDITKKAVKGGWIGMLHGFCEKHGRVPAGEKEIGDLIHEAKEITDVFENAVRDLAEPCDKFTRKRREVIVDWGQKIMEARAELEARFG